MSRDQLCIDRQEAINRICYPLFTQSPIDYFDYARFYDSGEVIYIGTSPSLFKKNCQAQLLPTYEELYLFCSSGLRSTILSHSMPLTYGPDLNPERYQKNIYYAAKNKVFHRLYLIERQQDFYVNYGFGVKNASKQIFSFYLNTMPLLERFCRYFERSAIHLIHDEYQHRKIILPNYYEKKILLSDEIQLPFERININLSFDHPLVVSQAKSTQVTDREKECLRLFSQGFTMRNIAEKLDISPRTVEMHLRNVKSKLKINKKNDLINIWQEYFK